MSFGPQSTLSLNLDGIGTLPLIRSGNVLSQMLPERKEKIIKKAEDAEANRSNARQNLKMSLINSLERRSEDLLRVLDQTNSTELNSTGNNYYQEFIEANMAFNETQIIRKYYLNNVEIKPNVFVVVSIDSDNENREPLFVTKVFRENTSPFIHENKSKIPIGLLAHGIWGSLLLNSDKRSPYTPNAIYFSIYHDIGEDQEPSKTTWTRDTPHRDYLIGKARLPFVYLMNNGCAAWHELPILDQRDMPIKDCVIRVKSQVCTAIPLSGISSSGCPLTIGGIACGEPEIPCVCGNGCGGACNVHTKYTEHHNHTHRKRSCKRRVKHKVVRR